MPPTSSLPVSVVVISLNEERRIGDCLDSVRALTDDIIVVDGHSRDCTCEICRARGARVLPRMWSGYSDQKNFGNAQARHDWILSLDADERVTPELAASLRVEFGLGPRCDAYAIRFENYFDGRRIRFGAWNPEWHVRLFDRRKLQWNTDDVHEGLAGDPDVRVGRLHGCIRHLAAESHAQLAGKTERYSALFAARARRRARPPHWWKIWLNPAWRFARDYGLRLGVLDGRPGALIAWEAARYTYLKYARAMPMTRRPSRLAPRLGLMTAAMLALLLVRMTAPGWQPEHSPSPHSAELSVPPATAHVLASYDDDDDDPLDVESWSDDDEVLA